MTTSVSRHVVVTGATGFIGSRLVLKLLRRGHTVTALVRRPDRATHLRALGVQVHPGDVTRPEGLLEAMQGADWVLHLANHYSLHERDERLYQAVNVEGNRHVMQAALQAGVRKVVHVSSGVSYGVSPDQPLTETSRVGPHPTAYWQTKHLGDQVVWDAHRQGLPVVLVYPGGVLGANDPNPTGAWIRRLVRRQQLFRAFDAQGFTFVHVDDVAEAVVRAAERDGNVGERYLVGREYLTNQEFVRLVTDLAGTPVPWLQVPDWAAHVGGQVMTGLNRLTGLTPLMDISSGSVRHLAAGFRFGSDKAERELGLEYTPVREALEEAIRTLRA